MKNAFNIFCIFICTLLGFFPVGAEESPDPAKLDPSDIYFQGWLALRDASDFEEKEDHVKALEAATRCKRLIDTVTLYHPDWKPHLISRKRTEVSSVLDRLTEIQPVEKKADGPALYQTPEEQAEQALPRGLSQAEIRQASRIQRDLEEAQLKIKESGSTSNAEIARLKRQVKSLLAERDQLASSALSAEVRQLKNRLELVEDEKRILSRQLADTRSELSSTRAQLEARIKELSTKEKESRTVANQLNVMLKKQSSVSSETITDLRKQQQQLKKDLSETRNLLAEERENSKKLERLLTDARGEIRSLTTERDNLLKERDHLASLLKMEHGDRIQKLIEQNITLAQQMRNAEKAMRTLQDNADASSTELSEVKGELTLAKAQLIKLRQENDSSNQRRIDLERKLSEVRVELEARESLSDLDSDLKQENDILREVVEKLLVTQKRQREQADLLLKTAEENPEMADVARIFTGEELTLTEEEKRFLDTQKISTEFRFNANRANPEEVKMAGLQLRRYTNAISTAIKKAYHRGKPEIALDLCNQLLDDNPGHVPTMVNQGVIQFKLGLPQRAIDSFKNAITLQPTRLPYAHFMLGCTHHAINQLQEARKEYEVALQFDTQQKADTHNRLGVVHAQAQRLKEAREQFEKAYRLDPSNLDPLENLTQLYDKTGQKKAALNYYRQYLKAGGQPRPDLERTLGKALQKAAIRKATQAQSSSQ